MASAGDSSRMSRSLRQEKKRFVKAKTRLAATGLPRSTILSINLLTSRLVIDATGIGPNAGRARDWGARDYDTARRFESNG